MSYETYGNMSTTQKDSICDGIEIQKMINQHDENVKNRRAATSLKRHPTNHSQINDDYHTEEYQDDEGDFQEINYSRQRKRFTKDKDDRIHPRTIINSNINNNNNTQTTTNNNNTTGDHAVRITKHALDYAVEYHYQPIKIEIEPKIKDQREGSKFIQSFLQSIKTDFLKQNVLFNRPLLFDLWWIDGDGNIRAISKSAEIVVYLSQANRYPKEVNHHKITPHPPKHLPPQHTAILKWVKNSISYEDVKEEINNKYKSLFRIEEIMGTKNDRNRHIRIELLDKKEYMSMLNSGKISIFGHLYDIDEYLPSPKLLLCSRCNQAGHVRKNCKTSSFDICKRCGGDRHNGEDHKDCKIRCHHCQGDHTSTDFKCPFLLEYRRRLIIEIRKRPDLLPPDVQLFIPSEYRDQGDRTKIIYNNTIQKQQQYMTYDRSDVNVWPHISQHHLNINNEPAIKIVEDELQILKKKFEEEQIRIEQKYKNHLNVIKQSWLMMQQQIETQTQILSTINNTINQILFSTCQKTINVVFNVMNKIKTQTKSNEYDEIINEISTHASFINDTQSSYINHQLSLDKLINKQKESFGNAFYLLSDENNGE